MPHEPLIVLMDAERSPVEADDTSTSQGIKPSFSYKPSESKVAFLLQDSSWLQRKSFASQLSVRAVCSNNCILSKAQLKTGLGDVTS